MSLIQAQGPFVLLVSGYILAVVRSLHNTKSILYGSLVRNVQEMLYLILTMIEPCSVNIIYL